MTTAYAQPLLPGQPETASFDLKALLLEPVLLVGSGLFWLIALPVTGLFCAGVALYDKVAALKKKEIRLPDLRTNPGSNPLVLRKKSLPAQSTARPARSAAEAFQS